MDTAKWNEAIDLRSRCLNMGPDRPKGVYMVNGGFRMEQQNEGETHQMIEDSWDPPTSLGTEKIHEQTEESPERYEFSKNIG